MAIPNAVHAFALIPHRRALRDPKSAPPRGQALSSRMALSVDSVHTSIGPSAVLPIDKLSVFDVS